MTQIHLETPVRSVPHFDGYSVRGRKRGSCLCTKFIYKLDWKQKGVKCFIFITWTLSSEELSGGVCSYPWVLSSFCISRSSSLCSNSDFSVSTIIEIYDCVLCFLGVSNLSLEAGYLPVLNFFVKAMVLDSHFCTRKVGFHRVGVEVILQNDQL